MDSNFQKEEDNPAITASDAEKVSLKNDSVVDACSNADENNNQQTTGKADLSAAEQPSPKQKEGKQQVKLQNDNHDEEDSVQMETTQETESRPQDQIVPENMESSQDCNDSTETAKTGDEGGSSLMEAMEEGDDLPKKGSCTSTDSDATNCVVPDKSATVADKEDGSDEVPQTGVAGTASASNSSACTKPDSINFLSALNLLPRKRSSEEPAEVESGSSNSAKHLRTNDQNGVGPAVSTAITSPTLTQLFKKEPDNVVQLLAAAIPMDSLSSLLKEEHKRSTTQLKQLRERLEKAHHTVEVCSQQKQPLLEQINAVTEKIQIKQKQLMETREDLRRLSTQEADIKAKRDTIHSKCSELRRKLLASREALLQIQQLYSNKRQSAAKAVKAS